jgi:hypothetical protein
MRHDPALKRLIPLTPLRHFYDRLRDFCSDSFHREAAREWLRRPDRVQELIAASVAHFGLYDNRDELFRPAPMGLTAARTGNPDLANRLLGLIARGATGVPSRPELEFDFVDYELSPVRTTGSEFESGESGRSSGKGGVDVLLANRVDRLPAVGELKADTDVNPFLGFVQSLTYAVELATPAQRVRLAASYPGRFAWPGAGPYIDVYLLLIRHPEDRPHAEFLDLVRGIASRLCVHGSPYARLVRRLACLRTAYDDGDRAEFGSAFVVEPSVTPPTG